MNSRKRSFERKFDYKADMMIYVQIVNQSSASRQCSSSMIFHGCHSHASPVSPSVLMRFPLAFLSTFLTKGGFSLILFCPLNFSRSLKILFMALFASLDDCSLLGKPSSSFGLLVEFLPTVKH